MLLGKVHNLLQHHFSGSFVNNNKFISHFSVPYRDVELEMSRSGASSALPDFNKNE